MKTGTEVRVQVGLKMKVGFVRAVEGELVLVAVGNLLIAYVLAEVAS